MVTLTSQQGNIWKSNAHMLALLIFKDERIRKRQLKAIAAKHPDLSAGFKGSGFTGKLQETLLLFPASLKGRRMLLIGLGEKAKLTTEQLRRVTATAAKTAQTAGSASLALLEPDPYEMRGLLQQEEWAGGWETIGLAIAEGAGLALYRFDRYFTGENAKKPTLKRFSLVTENPVRARAIAKGVRTAAILCEATYLARDLENAPGNEIYPESLARHASAAGRKSKFRVTILNERRIKALNMGGLIGVAQGSSKPPRFIIMEHNTRKRGIPTVVLVGKGVTFDSGGISIKPAASMAEMKMDMSGAAAVIGTMQAAARLRLPIHLVGLVPATENLLNGDAMKPGDILTHYNGKTSEVDNTDAEGRLILADALGYASKYNPDLVIDLATLTGACVVALGHFATGMMGNDQQSMDRLRESGERTYERVWQLPMFDEYDKLIKSDVADVKNVGGRWGGAITAAMFLRHFIGEYKWIHLDIAGTAILEESQDYIPKGGSGVGVRLLVDFLSQKISLG
ncbi:MAG: leucyl aminopeptidase [Bacteroidota bacterium]